MEEAAELANYLPLSFKTPKEQEYIEFLWDAFETNYTHGKYQFAFLAYHMLTMSFVYFNIWQIKQTEPKDFAMGLIGFGKDIEKSLLDATSPFVFSTVNERTMLRFLKLIACDNSKIGTYAKLVDDRNESAHPNGNIFYSTEAALDIKITEILRVVDEIQTHSKPVIEHCYREFLLQNHDPDEREYPDAADQIREVLIHGNYLSQKDIEICLGFDLGFWGVVPETRDWGKRRVSLTGSKGGRGVEDHELDQRRSPHVEMRMRVLRQPRAWRHPSAIGANSALFLLFSRLRCPQHPSYPAPRHRGTESCKIASSPIH